MIIGEEILQWCCRRDIHGDVEVSTSPAGCKKLNHQVMELKKKFNCIFFNNIPTIHKYISKWIKPYKYKIIGINNILILCLTSITLFQYLISSKIFIFFKTKLILTVEKNCFYLWVFKK